MKTFEERLNYVAPFCIRRAGTKNRESTRALCNCIETDDAEKLLAHLVRRAHRNPRLKEGALLMFVPESLNNAAIRHGIPVISQ